MEIREIVGKCFTCIPRPGESLFFSIVALEGVAQLDYVLVALYQARSTYDCITPFDRDIVYPWPKG